VNNHFVGKRTIVIKRDPRSIGASVKSLSHHCHPACNPGKFWAFEKLTANSLPLVWGIFNWNLVHVPSQFRWLDIDPGLIYCALLVITLNSPTS
jgi:hypothetical protein